MSIRACALAVAALSLFACAGDRVAAELVTERDVVYCTISGIDLKLDITYRRGDGEPAPMLMQIHGGGWIFGDKAGSGTYPLPLLVERGYVVASVNHRPASAHRFPAQIEDVKCAVRYLRANAGRYGGDPDKMGVCGTSSGGQLAALLGLTDPSDGFDDAGQYPGVSSSVQAVVDLFGPSDLTDPAVFPEGRVLVEAFGTADRDSPMLRAGSPVSYERSDAPPFLLIHGDRDGLVPLSQSEKLDAYLRSKGIASTLVVVRNANHNFAAEGGVPDPGPDEIEDLIVQFFADALGRP